MTAGSAATRARHPVLIGRPEEQPRPQPAVGGWHWVEWLCEYAGTLFQLFLGFGAVALFETPASPLYARLGTPWLRLVVIGLCFGALAAAVATSPVGKRSGAHLNPAVTAGFWANGHTSVHDLVGYAVAQTLGALTAAAGFSWLWRPWSHAVHGATTRPGPGLSGWEAAGIEAGLTFVLLTVIFAMVSSSRTARLTPAVVTVFLAGLIRVGAPLTGASMNPSRTFGPVVVSGGWATFWIYLVGPVAGALLASVVFRTVAAERRTLTAKLFHDERYPTTQRTELPARRAQASAMTPATTPTPTASHVT